MTESLRQSVEARLQNEAARLGRDLGWVRRRYAFVRLLHRLVAAAPDMWVVKGGVAVELRRPGLARATRDLDLALRTLDLVDAHDPDALTDLLRSALGRDVDDDGLEMQVGPPTPMAEDSYGRPAWRFIVGLTLAGRRFTSVRLDVVSRPEELVGMTGLSLDRGSAAPAGAVDRIVLGSDLRQQFAEKLHALTRTYATGESTRVKDLLDLVLLVHDGVPTDETLVDTVRTVFAVRASHAVPTDLGPPPTAWRARYEELAADLGVEPSDLDTAHDLVAATWRAARFASPQGD